METNIVLQPLMSFSPWMIGAGIFLVLASIALIVIAVLARRILTHERKQAPQQVTPRQIASIRQESLSELIRVESEFDSHRIDARAAAEASSICVRKFAAEVTGTKYDAMTLRDIERKYSNANAVGLAAAISKCYGSEFPVTPDPSVKAAIAKCRQVIELWS